MGLSHSQRRARSGDLSIDVYPADESRKWRAIRKVTPLYAWDKVSRGLWSELFDDFGNFYGVQILAIVKTDKDLPSGATATTITAADSKLCAGLSGPSRTLGLTEEGRITRFHSVTCRPLPPEDRIERAIAKVNQWPMPASRIDNGTGAPVFGDRAVRVYPRIK